MKETEATLLAKNSSNPISENIKTIKGKIILIDDQKYECELLLEGLKKKNWHVKVEYFMDAEDAYQYLINTKDDLFLIISDLNMPKMSGLELKKAIDSHDDLRKKTIPFIFSSTSELNEQVIEAYEYRVQGFFTKPLTVEKQAEMLDIIIKYWIVCKHPVIASSKLQA